MCRDGTTQTWGAEGDGGRGEDSPATLAEGEKRRREEIEALVREHQASQERMISDYTREGEERERFWMAGVALLPTFTFQTHGGVGKAERGAV